MPRAADVLIAEYESWSNGSKRRAAEAERYLPGGDTRSSAHYAPYPLFMTHGEGARLHDVDGHVLIDFMNNFTSLIHGHGHPPTVEAIRRQAARGTAYAAPTESQIELARLLCERVPSVDELRFTSSGSEATAMTLRAARAFTGRPKIMKVEGGYNGSHDIGEASLVPLGSRAGSPERPNVVRTDRSLAETLVDELVITPFNAPEITAALLEEHAEEIAALIVEPMLGGLGMIPPQTGYLARLRELTREHDVLLIFDEVITLRLSMGGLQAIEGVTPDLTAMAKIIGGGLPVGAFGGRRDIMEIFNPGKPDAIMHASTFSGNALTMAAGLATLQALDEATFDRLEGLGDRLRSGFASAFERHGIRGRATGRGSLTHVHFTDEPVVDARVSVRAASDAGPIPALLHLGMLRRGVFPAGRQMYCISTPMSAADVDHAVAALDDTLAELGPAIEESAPALIADRPVVAR